MGKLRVLSSRGDDETAWETGAYDSALAEFNEKLANGYAAFAKRGDVTERVREFDPSADEIILTRQLIGG